MSDKLLYRQIHPYFVHNGIVTSQAFKPMKNKKTVSVYDGDLIDAKPAWDHYTKGGHKSDGVMAVTGSECNMQKLTVTTDHIPYKEHAVIDFDDLSRNVIKNTAKVLAVYANDRSWCYRQAIEFGA